MKGSLKLSLFFKNLEFEILLLSILSAGNGTIADRNIDVEKISQAHLA